MNKDSAAENNDPVSFSSEASSAGASTSVGAKSCRDRFGYILLIPASFVNFPPAADDDLAFWRLAEKKTRHEATGSWVGNRGGGLDSGAEVEGRDAWIGVRCEDLPAGGDWWIAVDGRLSGLGTVGEAERRCLWSLFRVGGREFGADAGREVDWERDEEGVEDAVEVVGEVVPEEDEDEKDSDSRRSHFREVDGREKLVGKEGNCFSSSCREASMPMSLKPLPFGDAVVFRIKGGMKLLEWIGAFVRWSFKSLPV